MYCSVRPIIMCALPVGSCCERQRLPRHHSYGRLAPAPGLGCGGALGLDAFQQPAGGFVVGVLRHQFATEGFGQDALGQVVDTAFGRGDFGFQLVGEGEELFDAADYFGLFFDPWHWK